MTNPDHTPRTPWAREPPPWVPEPTPTGRAILRLWIEEQLRLVAAARERRAISRWGRRSAKSAKPEESEQPDGSEEPDRPAPRQPGKHRKSRQRGAGGGAAGAVPSRNQSLPSPPAR